MQENSIRLSPGSAENKLFERVRAASAVEVAESGLTVPSDVAKRLFGGTKAEAMQEVQDIQGRLGNLTGAAKSAAEKELQEAKNKLGDMKGALAGDAKAGVEAAKGAVLKAAEGAKAAAKAAAEKARAAIADRMKALFGSLAPTCSPSFVLALLLCLCGWVVSEELV